METAKVDIQKLQLLNDRITQTIDALNQVRLSVHGLQSSVGPSLGQIPSGAYGIGLSHTGAFAQPGFGPVGLQQQPGFSQLGGFSPTGFAQQAYGTPQGIGGGYYGVQPGVMQNPWGMQGLSHSAVDPNWQARLMQTFPYVRHEATGVGI